MPFVGPDDARAAKEIGIRPLTPAGTSKSQRDVSDPVPRRVAVKIVRYSCRELVLVDDLYPCPFRLIGGHDGSFLIIDRVARVDFVVGVRSHTGEVMSVYLMDADIEKLREFLRWKHD
jgi:hypothetical protein